MQAKLNCYYCKLSYDIHILLYDAKSRQNICPDCQKKKQREMIDKETIIETEEINKMTKCQAIQESWSLRKRVKGINPTAIKWETTVKAWHKEHPQYSQSELARVIEYSKMSEKEVKYIARQIDYTVAEKIYTKFLDND